MFATVECEATVFGLRKVRTELASEIPCVLALPGADHVLDFLPVDRWALLSHVPLHEVDAQFRAAELPVPKVVVTAPARKVGPVEADDELTTAFQPQQYVEAITELGADPSVSLSFEDTPDGVTAAKAAGLQVIGVAAVLAPEALDGADLVIPSLLSVRVLGTHPFIVMEVDAIPDVGTGSARRR